MSGQSRPANDLRVSTARRGTYERAEEDAQDILVNFKVAAAPSGKTARGKRWVGRATLSIYRLARIYNYTGGFEQWGGQTQKRVEKILNTLKEQAPGEEPGPETQEMLTLLRRNQLSQVAQQGGVEAERGAGRRKPGM